MVDKEDNIGGYVSFEDRDDIYNDNRELLWEEARISGYPQRSLKCQLWTVFRRKVAQGVSLTYVAFPMDKNGSI